VATKLSASLEFPATAATIFAMLSEPSYLELKCAQSEKGTFNITENAHERIILTERSLDEIPDSYQKFLGSDLIIQEEQKWLLDNRMPFQANWKIVIEGKPILLEGTLYLEDTVAGSLLTLEAEVTVSIPFFGGMAENFIREHFITVIADERAIGLQWLSSHK